MHHAVEAGRNRFAIKGECMSSAVDDDETLQHLAEGDQEIIIGQFADTSDFDPLQSDKKIRRIGCEFTFWRERKTTYKVRCGKGRLGGGA